MTEVARSWDCHEQHPEHGLRRREAYVHGDTVVVRSVDREARTSPWTSPGSPLPVPDHVTPGTLRIRAVVPHEWTTDLVVEFLDNQADMHLESWRVSPVRLLEIRDLVPEVIGAYFRIQCEVSGDSHVRRIMLLTRDETHVFTHTVEVSALKGGTLVDSKHKRRSYALFVSYKSEDGAFARQVVERLKVKGIDLWFAPLQDRGKFARDMPELIARARHVLLLLSKGSFDEWERALDDPLEPPYKQAHEIIQAIELKDSKNLILCCADETTESAVRAEVKHDNRHVYTRAEAVERYGVEAGADGYARVIADYVLARMRQETLK